MQPRSLPTIPTCSANVYLLYHISNTLHYHYISIFLIHKTKWTCRLWSEIIKGFILYIPVQSTYDALAKSKLTPHTTCLDNEAGTHPDEVALVVWSHIQVIDLYVSYMLQQP